MGFSLFNKFQKNNKTKYKNEMKTKKKNYLFLFIGIDHLYIKNRLIKLQMINTIYKPKLVVWYCNLKFLNILKNFKQKFKMLINHYYQIITNPSELKFYYHIYKFSYLKTLARRMQININQAFMRYNNILNVTCYIR